MSNYTTQVRFLCEHEAGLTESVGYNDINETISVAAPHIFGDFPIFDETYRTVLETKILKHYYLREIGEETAGLWKFRLNTRMNEIMPYYNQLYKSELLQFNPLYDVDYTRSGEKTGEDTGTEERSRESVTTDRMTGTILDERETTQTDRMTGTIHDAGTSELSDQMTGTIIDTSEGDTTRTDNLSRVSRDSGTDSDSSEKRDKNDHWDYFSDTPQGSVQNMDISGNMYLTNARHITDDGNGSTASSTKTYGKTTTTTDTGTQGTATESENQRTYNTLNERNGEDENTRTYNTTNTRTGEDENTRTHNTLNTRNDDGSETTNRTLNTLDNYIEHVVGKTGGASYSKLLLEFRETFINIDMLIIKNLADLFFGLWE